MIEINLIQKRKKTKIPTVMGMDLSKINMKMLAVALAIYFAQDMFLADMLNAEVAKITTVNDKLRKNLNKLVREVKSHQNVKMKLEAYNKKEEELKKRSSYVDKILKTRTNPRKVLEKVARSIPDDMWFESMTINDNKEIILKGKAEAYKSIGDFLTISNESAFFGKSLTLSNSSTKDEILYGKKKRIEYFEIKGFIDTFDPWKQ